MAGRGSILCNGQGEARIDPESLERDNDKDIDSLAEKTSFLRQVTGWFSGIVAQLLVA